MTTQQLSTATSRQGRSKPLYRLVASAALLGLFAQGAQASCQYLISNEWNSGFTGSIRITNDNNNPISNWAISWQYSGANRITSSWNATVSGNNPYSAQPLSWNASIQPGQSVEFGFQGNKNGGSLEIPALSGNLCSSASSARSSSSAPSSIPPSSSSRPSSSSVPSSAPPSSSAVPSSSIAAGQQCNWYGTLYPLCVTTQSGWGWENNKSCISASTCSSQPAPYGIVGATNRPPVAVVRTNSSSAGYGTTWTLALDASQSSDPDGDSLVFSWDGGQTFSSSATYSELIYPMYDNCNNIYRTFTVTVKDTQGATDSESINILIHPAAPGNPACASSSRSSSSSRVSSSSTPSSSSSSAASVAAYRGVNLAGADFGEGYLPGIYETHYIYPDQTSVDYFRGKRMNTVRLPFRWERLQRSLLAEFDATELARLDGFVTATTAKGVNVLLDPHNYARYNGQLVGSSSVPNSALANFWSRLAQRYKSNPRVIFGLMNEPHTMPTEQWVSAANEAIVAIRATGANNLILVPGNAWTGAHSWYNNWYGTPNATAMLGIQDSGNNFAFDVHQYLDADASGTSPSCVSTSIGVERLTAFTNWLYTNNKRGFLGEFAGGDNPVCSQALSNMLQYMSEHPSVWIGWTWWAAGPWWEDYFYSIEPTASGGDKPQMQVLIPYLPAN